MKKLFVCICLALASLVVTGCAKKEKLYVINVGDYINYDLVSEFEKQYNCQVVYKECNSNEQIYQTLKNDSYDVAVISDYMIDKMAQENLLADLSEVEFENYKFDNLFEDAQTLINNNCRNYKNKFIPYYWGTVGILYKDNSTLDAYVKEKGLLSMFENNDYRKGMYDSARDCLCMGLFALDNSVDINTSDEAKLNEALATIKSVNYTMWGDDNLKRAVYEDSIDMALVYSGDYLDLCWLVDDEGGDINFKYYAPDYTNIWIDGMVVLDNASNKDLAYKFLDFFAQKDNCVENSVYIGYAPLFEDVFNTLYTDYEEDMLLSREEFYPYKATRQMYKHVSNEHYITLNDLLDKAKQGK